MVSFREGVLERRKGGTPLNVVGGDNHNQRGGLFIASEMQHKQTVTSAQRAMETSMVEHF